MSDSSAPGVMNDLSIALVMFDGAEEQDVVGPYEMFWWMTAFQELPTDRPIKESDFSYTFNLKDGTTPNVFTVAPTTDPIVMSSGMKFIADFSYETAPPANVVVVPGGHGARNIPALEANGTLDYIKGIANAETCKYVMSVCTGTFVLGAAGLLDDKHCLVYSNQFERFEREVPAAKLVKDGSLSFVQDGRVFTSNGPCSGLATSLRLVEVHCGTGYKNNLRELLAYLAPPVKGAVSENGTLTEATV
ncbi:MAG: DJ-1/PfpI family protein [Rhodanobacter sp.]